MSNHHTHEGAHDACHEHDHPDDPARGGVARSTKPSALMTELRAHVPFSVAAVAIGLIVAGTICILVSTADGVAGREPLPSSVAASDDTHDHGAHEHADHDHTRSPARLLFHLFHPVHMLFSATATTAMFFRYDRRAGKAVIVGLIGAIGVCGISDIVMPHASLFILDTATPWHVCVLEHPGLVLPFAFVGVFIGLAASASVIHGTIISHSLHVFASTMASIFYMVTALGETEWIGIIGQVFVFVALAVVVPCCLSDIVFPMLMTKAGREQFDKEPHVH